jgi:hypothetical protein
MTTAPAIDYEAIVGRGDQDDEPKYSGPFHRREPNLILKETGDSAILRLLQESPEWYQARTHRFVEVTRSAPEGYEGKWPGGLSATCREDEKFKAINLYPDGCPICESPQKNKFNAKQTMRDSAVNLRYTLAVEREEVVGDGSPEMGGPEMAGKKGYRDKMVKVPVWGDDGEPLKDEEGKVISVERPSLVIVSGTMYSMFGGLKAMAETYDSLRRRDFKVKRVKNPTGNGDMYQWFPMDPIPGLEPGTDNWKVYEETIKAWCPGGLSVARIIGEKSSHEYFERFFTREGKLVWPKEGGAKPQSSGGGNGFAVPSAAPQQVDQDKLAAMQARIMRQSQPEG